MMDSQKTLSSSLVEKLHQRQIVQTDLEIMSGAPVFVGTRVPLQTLFDYLEGGEGLNEFSEDFPHLRTPAIQVLETIAHLMIYQNGIIDVRIAG